MYKLNLGKITGGKEAKDIIHCNIAAMLLVWEKPERETNKRDSKIKGYITLGTVIHVLALTLHVVSHVLTWLSNTRHP